MACFQCAVSQNIASENVASPNNQAAEQAILLPFTRKLVEDKKLKWSKEDFKQKIFDFFEDKNITALSQLAEIPAFPTPYVLALFASKAYTDYEKADTDAQYEARLDLPAGWKLLTTACNTGKKNGYFGAAYWHPEHQQVVIAHRGTKFKTCGALWSDVRGVFSKHFVKQMDSACTFACKVVDVLRHINQEKGVHFQVFFTGHSLGGWLAQITTFTTEYLCLKGEENIFLKSENVSQCYHPHTVVFESPGCKDMLLKMADTFDVRLNGSSIDLQHLDITTYLSAPNRVNTCYTHLGTAYRIFTDVSNISWWSELTGWYNIQTHGIDNIVEALNPEGAQVHQDTPGQVKVHVVVDWPLCKTLLRSKEYKRFFNWAKQFNNYHPAITNNPFPGYCNIRYQTRSYEDLVTSLSIFSQQERQFLQCCHSIRHLPGIFKPKDMFAALEDNEAQEEAEIILNSFEIGKDTIRCADACALQTLIPYVKRLLQLYPNIKWNTQGILTSQQISNNVYQTGTEHYLREFKRSKVRFNPEASSLRDFLHNSFLSSDTQNVLMLHMVDGDAWTGLMKVCQVLQNSPFMKNLHYNILTLEHLLLVNQIFNLNELIKSKTKTASAAGTTAASAAGTTAASAAGKTAPPYLLLMSCEKNQAWNDENKQIFSSLFNIINKESSVKIILTMQSKNETFTFLQQSASETLSNGYVTKEEHLSWSELTQASRMKFLENSINFQGKEIALNQLISAESPVANSLPLADLIAETNLQISAESVPKSKHLHCDEIYYIDRTFTHQVNMLQVIFYDKTTEKFPDLLAHTEQEFQQLCHHNQQYNVHWLERDKSGNLLWQKSQGSLRTVREYIDKDISHIYTPVDLDKLLEQVERQQVMLISDTAGMGKSTVLTHMSKKIKEKCPTKWVLRIDLNDHTEVLKALKGEHIDTERAITVLSERLLKLKPGLEMEMFKHCAAQDKVKIIIMFDGFDEISPTCKDEEIHLLQALKQTAVEQLWVTTRPHLRYELEDKLQQLSYTLQTFTNKNQVEFLTKFWSVKEWFNKPANRDEEKKIEMYAEKLLEKLAQSVSDKERHFAGIPLQCRMLAEAFDAEVKTCYQSANPEFALEFKLDLCELYRRFLDTKYDIYRKEKSQPQGSTVAADEECISHLERITEDHRLLALIVLLGEEEVKKFEKNISFTLKDEGLARIGIAQKSREGNLNFIHRTFAEYYVADFFVNKLNKWDSTSQEVQNYLLRVIFVKEYYEVIRVFIDGLLSRCEPSGQVMEQYGQRIHDLRGNSLQIFHNAVQEGNGQIILFLLHSLQAGQHRDTIHFLFLGRDKYDDRRNLWEHAVWWGNKTILDMIWECARHNLTDKDLDELVNITEQHLHDILIMWENKHNITAIHNLLEWTRERRTEAIIKRILSPQDCKELTTLHLAAQNINFKIFEELWKWGTKTLTSEQMKIFFLQKDQNRRVLLEGKSATFFKKMWKWGKEKLTADEIQLLLLKKGCDEKSVLEVALERNNTAFFEALWRWCVKSLTFEEMKLLLLEKDYHQYNVLHLAAGTDNAMLLQEMWKWSKETLTLEEMKLLLLEKDYLRRTVLHVALERDNTTMLNKLWKAVMETLTSEEIKFLFWEKDRFKRPVLNLALMNKNLLLFEELWKWGSKTLNALEMKLLLLEKDPCQNTALHVAVDRTNNIFLQEVWNWGRDVQHSETIKSLLFAQGYCQRTSLHQAVHKTNCIMFEKLWRWSIETLTAAEMKVLLLKRDENKMTVLHEAVEKNTSTFIEEIWKWCTETLTADEVKLLILERDCRRKTVLHIAVENTDSIFFEEMWTWVTEALTSSEMNLLLVEEDCKGKTVLQLAAEREGTAFFEIIWKWCMSKLNEAEMKLLFLHRDCEERTVLHMAARKNKTTMIVELWQWSTETLTAEEIKLLLLGKDCSEDTILHLAVEGNNIMFLQQVWNWGKEALTSEENSILFLEKGYLPRTVLHLAIRWDKSTMFEMMWNWVKQSLTSEQVYFFLFKCDEYPKHLLHAAVESATNIFFEELWKWCAETLTSEQIKLLLLERHDYQRTVLHMAIENTKTIFSEVLWKWCTEALTTGEMKMRAFLKDIQEEKFLHLAVQRKITKFFEKFWNWSRETLTSEDTKILLLQKDCDQKTVLHMAGESGNTMFFEEIWKWISKTLPSQEIKLMLLEKDNLQKTVLHVAVCNTKSKIFQQLWKWVKETLTSEEVKELLLEKDNNQMTVLHEALERKIYAYFKEMWNWSKETLTSVEIKFMLLQKDSNQMPVFHLVVHRKNNRVFEAVWEWLMETRTAEEIKCYLLERECNHKTVFHVAVKAKYTNFLKRMWKWGRETLTAEDMKSLLLEEDCEEKTVLHVAVNNDNSILIEEFWKWAKETLTAEEIKFFLLKKDVKVNTVLHAAVQRNEKTFLEGFWKWAKETLTAEVMNLLLLEKDLAGKPVLHLAVERRNTVFTEELWKWGTETLTSEEMKLLLLEKDLYKNTVLHVAVQCNRSVFLNEFWKWGTETLTSEEVKLLLLYKDCNRKTV